MNAVLTNAITSVFFGRQIAQMLRHNPKVGLDSIEFRAIQDYSRQMAERYMRWLNYDATVERQAIIDVLYDCGIEPQDPSGHLRTVADRVRDLGNRYLLAQGH